MSAPAGGSPPLDSRGLTWAALLGRWVDFARSALALPDDEEGRRLRASVPDIIMLQAVWFALGEVDQLDAVQRQVGMDRAEVLIERHERALRERWGSSSLSPAMAELVHDARVRLAEVQRRGDNDSMPKSE